MGTVVAGSRVHVCGVVWCVVCVPLLTTHHHHEGQHTRSRSNVGCQEGLTRNVAGTKSTASIELQQQTGRHADRQKDAISFGAPNAEQQGSECAHTQSPLQRWIAAACAHMCKTHAQSVMYFKLPTQSIMAAAGQS